MTRSHAIRRAVVAAISVIMLSHTAARSAAQIVRGQLRSSDKGCVISATPVSFGTYDALNTRPTESQGTISYECGTHEGDLRTPVKNIQIELSSGSSGNYSSRTLQGGGDRLQYNVYLDAAHQTIWGDGTSGTDVLRHSNPQNHQTYTVQIYGRILPQQDVLFGSYTDTLIATIEW